MQYDLEISLDLPRARVIELFEDQDNLPKWLDGYVEHQVLEGEHGQVGTRTRFVFQMGKRQAEIFETVTLRDLPDEFSGIFETKGMWNSVRNRFEEAGSDRTRWITHNEFRFQGFMKVVGWLMPGSFKKQSLKHMQDFKAFAESQA